MADLLVGLIPHLKSLHIAALLVWCGGLFALPLMLTRHDPSILQADYTRIRRATHFGYIFAITPAAVIAIGSGIALIFLREVYVPWFFAKLVVVALLVGFHGWVGSTLVRVAETVGSHVPPHPGLPLILLLMLLAAILTLVLAKPDLEVIPLPGWLMQPYEGPLPFAVPNP